VIGSGIAGRQHQESEGLVGFFVNNLGLRVRVGEEPTFAELLRQVREVTLAAFAHQEVPFEMVADSLDLERDPSYSPLVQVVLTYISHPAPPRRSGAVEIAPLAFDLTVAKFDLELALAEREGKVDGIFVYRTDLFDAASADAMLEGWRMVLTAATENGDVPLATLTDRLRQAQESRRESHRKQVRSLGQQKLNKLRRKAVPV